MSKIIIIVLTVILAVISGTLICSGFLYLATIVQKRFEFSTEVLILTFIFLYLWLTPFNKRN